MFALIALRGVRGDGGDHRDADRGPRAGRRRALRPHLRRTAGQRRGRHGRGRACGATAAARSCRWSSRWCCSRSGWWCAAPRPSMEVLVAGRVLQGLGGGALTVGLYVVVGLVFPRRPAAGRLRQLRRRLGAAGAVRPGARGVRRGRRRLALGVPRRGRARGGRGAADRARPAGARAAGPEGARPPRGPPRLGRRRSDRRARARAARLGPRRAGLLALGRARRRRPRPAPAAAARHAGRAPRAARR